MHNFHSESFGGGRVAKGVKRSGAAIEGNYRIDFTRSNVAAKADERHSILELAEMHGVEIDYSCRAGYCGECRVKCNGQVEINQECEISDQDRQAGYIYACCARAVSDLEIEA
jgi:ferredoxin